ncbi:NAD-dependent epimerase/dehydratase family protein [Xenorhabdus kozodoii]|uniref:UDP-2-acetamido-2,6-beta-L-arabino-hexul-4-ose reductase n=1 Tax=Xenorhabdus kozodoii TaxID=351676 RepID=A0A2D0L5J4_9GAMM|nr:NAD-dependent epimerase/dehydratase family protein [Xenorhabdus kozodoii]PHM70951.1 UDP-2-acetamido-2,6-beta-L-arabino-hexul-4-ose reductase [Xenorhabdus kozodoii]
MKKILIVGATGFIGKKVADYLIQQQEFDVIRYTRRPHQGFFSCELGDSAWQEMVKSCVAIINCSGVGLAKIKQQRNANETIARQLVESLPDIGKKYRLLHLSTVKAFNVHHYADARQDTGTHAGRSRQPATATAGHWRVVFDRG